MPQKTITLYSPDGEKYETTSRTEATRLRLGYGYSDTEPKSAAPKKAAAPKPPAKP